MAVIGLFIDEGLDFVPDLKIEDETIQTDEGLETAVLLSLFTDQRVSDDELPTGHTDKRGYWGDMYAEKDGDKNGSKLWLYLNGKQIVENLSKIEDSAKSALQWMIDDAIVKSVSAKASYPQPEFTLLEMQITKPDGNIYAFKSLWDGQKLKRA